MKEFPREEAAVAYDPEDEPSADLDRGAAAAVRRRHEGRLLGIDAVEGVGIGTGATGEDVIIVYVRDSALAARVPRQIEGVPIQIEVTGVIHALE